MISTVFCNPAEGYEKGLVEGLVGWARRNICVSVPRIESIGELNDELLKRCLEYEAHTVRGRMDTVGNLYAEDRMNLLPLPKHVFETARCMSVRVSASATVRFMSNAYSGPVKYADHTVSIKGYPETVEIYSEGLQISRHDRLYGKNQASYHLEDYMPLLEKRIQRADLLILDEMGYVSFDRFQSELLFRVVADRSEWGSIIVATNLAFSEWTSLFENTALVAALTDRLTFNSYILDTNGDFYRLDHTKRN